MLSTLFAAIIAALLGPAVGYTWSNHIGFTWSNHISYTWSD